MSKYREKLVYGMFFQEVCIFFKVPSQQPLLSFSPILLKILILLLDW